MNASAKIDQVGEEFCLSDSQFKQISEYVKEVTGIVIEEHKKQMVYARLSRRLRALGLSSFDDYLELLSGKDKKSELQDFVNSVTTNLTSFFRENHHFDHLADVVIQKKIAASDKKLRIWSAGCSTGEEPYCIAMTLLGLMPKIPDDYKVLATDLDTKVLKVASDATYPNEKLSGIPEKYRRFTGPAEEPEKFRFKDSARSLIHFRQLNLMSNWPMQGPFDAIFCRNVLIYFDPVLKANLIDRYADLLKLGGFLYIGHSESILGTHPRLDALGRTIYQRKA